MKAVSIPIVRLFFIVIYHSFRTFSSPIPDLRRFGDIPFYPFLVRTRWGSGFNTTPARRDVKAAGCQTDG